MQGNVCATRGAATVWVECPLSSADFERYPGCQQEMRTTDFVVRLLTASRASRTPVSNEPLGFAQHCPDSGRGCVANIFYAKVDELASLKGGGSARILGHAMAHEVGHLLLGENAHSCSGVMRGVWSLEDLEFMSWSELTFTPRKSIATNQRLTFLCALAHGLTCLCRELHSSQQVSGACAVSLWALGHWSRAAPRPGRPQHVTSQFSDRSDGGTPCTFPGL
jgi:hypothetical protein